MKFKIDSLQPIYVHPKNPHCNLITLLPGSKYSSLLDTMSACHHHRYPRPPPANTRINPEPLTCQRKTWTEALQDVVLDAPVGGDGRRRTDVHIEVRAIGVVVPAAPQHLRQVACDASGLRSGQREKGDIVCELWSANKVVTGGGVCCCRWSACALIEHVPVNYLRMSSLTGSLTTYRCCWPGFLSIVPM